MILSTARHSEHKLLVSDTLYLILSFVENERVPLFRQVCKTFKEVTELEVERKEGILYAYGKIKKYRCDPPFNLRLSDYVVSTYLFEWALENGYVFEPTLEELIEEKKRFPFNYSTNNWNITLWKYASKELLFKYVIQTGRTVLSKEEVFPHFIERWHSDEDRPDYIKLKDMGYSPRNPASLTNAIKFGASYSVIRWLSGECSLRKEHWLDLGNCELNVLKEILKHDDGQRYPFSKQELLVSWLRSSVQRNNLEIFKYFYEKYSHFYLQELNRERYLTEICAYAGEDILNFLTEEKIITPKLLSKQYADVTYSHCNLRCIKWLIEKGISVAEHQVILPLGLFDVPQHFTEHEWVNLSRWFLNKQLLTNAQKTHMFYSSIEEGSLPLFDLIFHRFRIY